MSSSYVLVVVPVFFHVLFCQVSCLLYIMFSFTFSISLSQICSYCVSQMFSLSLNNNCVFIVSISRWSLSHLNAINVCFLSALCAPYFLVFCIARFSVSFIFGFVSEMSPAIKQLVSVHFASHTLHTGSKSCSCFMIKSGLGPSKVCLLAPRLARWTEDKVSLQSKKHGRGQTAEFTVCPLACLGHLCVLSVQHFHCGLLSGSLVVNWLQSNLCFTRFCSALNQYRGTCKMDKLNVSKPRKVSNSTSNTPSGVIGVIRKVKAYRSSRSGRDLSTL